MRIAAIIVALFSLGACQQPPQAGSQHASGAPSSVKDWNSLTITLDRGPCYGRCPIYTVQIHGDGAVAWEGVNFVGAVGSRTGKISVESVRALVAKFEAAKFATLKDEYRGQITDGATYTVIFAHDGQAKVVTDYIGSMAGMPKAVSELEDAIDEAAGTAKWIAGYVPKPPPQ